MAVLDIVFLLLALLHPGLLVSQPVSLALPFNAPLKFTVPFAHVALSAFLRTAHHRLMRFLCTLIRLLCRSLVRRLRAHCATPQRIETIGGMPEAV
jgi:hypothetical protein